MVQGVWLLDGNVVLLTVPPCACHLDCLQTFILEYCKILFLKVSFKHDILCDGGMVGSVLHHHTLHLCQHLMLSTFFTLPFNNLVLTVGCFGFSTDSWVKFVNTYIDLAAGILAISCCSWNHKYTTFSSPIRSDHLGV